ncbi:Gfo/Idh/MocA family protein [candidate division KSB1 bacterium]
MSKKYRAGIIGCGRVAGWLEDDSKRSHPCTHAGAYLQTPRVELAAVAGRDKKNAKKFAKRFGVPAAYDDYRKMLADEKLDIVSVCTPAPSHHQMVLAAAAAGVKGILCEKAIATSLAEADRMVAVCRAKGVKLAVNHPRRYASDFRAVKKWLREGIIGDVIGATAHCSGNLIHTGSHLFDILRLFFNDAASVESVELEGGTGDAEGVSGYAEDEADKDDGLLDVGGVGSVTFADGVRVNVQGRHRDYFRFEIEIDGVRGQIKIGNGIFGLYGVGEAPYASGFKGLVPAPMPPVRDHGNVWVGAVNDLIDAIKNDKEPLSSGDDGLKALELALAFHVANGRKTKKISLPLKNRRLRITSR